MSEVVLVDRPAAFVARLLINRPAKRNAIDYAVRQALLDALEGFHSDSTIRAIVLGGVDGVFSAGGDLPSMGGLDAAQSAERMQHIHSLCRALAGCGLSIVSALEGPAAGAAVGMALLGDHIVVGHSTRILFPFLRLGLTPDWGQLYTLPRRVGFPTAWSLATSSDSLSGEDALRIGLADRLTADADVMDTAIGEAARLAQLPIEALRNTRARLSFPSASLSEELEREAAHQVIGLTGAEFAEGYNAFMQKRIPDFIAVPQKVSK